MAKATPATAPNGLVRAIMASLTDASVKDLRSEPNRQNLGKVLVHIEETIRENLEIPSVGNSLIKRTSASTRVIIARYKDGHWYRARLVKTTPTGARVKWTDGSTGMVKEYYTAA